MKKKKKEPNGPLQLYDMHVLARNFHASHTVPSTPMIHNNRQTLFRRLLSKAISRHSARLTCTNEVDWLGSGRVVRKFFWMIMLCIFISTGATGLWQIHGKSTESRACSVNFATELRSGNHVSCALCNILHLVSGIMFQSWRPWGQLDSFHRQVYCGCRNHGRFVFQHGVIRQCFLTKIISN